MKLKNLFLGLFFIVIGIIMISTPETCIKVIVFFTGIATIINGIYNLKNFLDLSDNPVYKKTLKIKSISSIIIGVLAVLFPLALMKSVEAIWTIVTFVLAVYFVFFAVAGFFSSSVDDNMDPESKKRITYESFIYFLIAILLFITPIGSIVKTLLIICGVVGLVVGAAIITKEIIYMKKQNKEITSGE